MACRFGTLEVQREGTLLLERALVRVGNGASSRPHDAGAAEGVRDGVVRGERPLLALPLALLCSPGTEPFHDVCSMAIEVQKYVI